MADMTLIQAIAFLEGLPEKVGVKGLQVMKEEFNHKDRPYATGETNKSFHYEVAGNFVFIGAESKGAYYVEKGRKAVRPKRANMLHWKSPTGADIFAMYSKPVKADDYIGRTVKRLKTMDFH